MGDVSGFDTPTVLFQRGLTRPLPYMAVQAPKKRNIRTI